VATGCGSDDASPEAAPETTASATTSTTAAPATTTTAAPATTTTAAAPTVGESDLGQFESFSDGTYTMYELGVPVTFTVTGSWSTQPINPGFFVITTPDSVGPGDHDIVAMAQPVPLLDGDDLADWLDSVPATATISEATAGEIGGFATAVFTIDAGESSLSGFKAGEAGGMIAKSFDPGFIYEVHWVEHPDGPISFFIGTPIDDLAWLDTARSVVETIEFG
jgi:hypothetical protein